MTNPLPRLAPFAVAGLLVLTGTWSGPGATATSPLAISFNATVGATPFECGKSFPGVGTTKSTLTASDFRFYVSNLKALDNAGRATPITLTQDGTWQSGVVALLDFENGGQGCTNGTAETRRVVEGTIPDGTSVAGLRFDVGLPFEVNHRDPTLQPSPLNLTRLFWNWNGGYKFMRIDIRSTGQPQGWTLHLGSTGCTPRQGPTTAPLQCARPNRPTITLSQFDATRQAVRFDLGALLAETNIDVNAPETPGGCMSADTDSDCRGIFRALGLPFGADRSSPSQRAFSAAAR
jgi:uncharacterized repeat protein (TIGR04052 family)